MSQTMTHASTPAPGWALRTVRTLNFLVELAKDGSISRHPVWAKYQARSALLIPWRILTGQAFFDQRSNRAHATPQSRDPI